MNRTNEYNKARERLVRIFREILPNHGFSTRQEQIDLSLHILDELAKRNVTLAEAEVGTGKTLAYLIAAIIIKRFKLNENHNTKLYLKMPSYQVSRMPIVVATSSIALQKALITEYIPQLSRILMSNKIIGTPITAVLRKGKEHYVCERNLREHLKFECDKSVRKTLEKLLNSKANFDLADVEITPYTKRSIGVSGKCSDNCPYQNHCRYLDYREQTQSFNIDIQVCNHNYFLVDTLQRSKNKAPLIPNYQLLIIDEAHKFLSAARSMYGAELSSTVAQDILLSVDRVNFSRESINRLAMKTVKKLYDQSTKLFQELNDTAKTISEENEDNENRIAVITDKAARHIRNIAKISEQLTLILHDDLFYIKARELLAWVRDKYDINTSHFDLSGFIKPTYEAGTHEKQRQLMQTQMYYLQNAICRLLKLESVGKLEQSHRSKRQRGNLTERQAINRNYVPLHEAVMRKAQKLLSKGAWGKNSEYISRIIWRIGQIQEQAANFSKHSKLICWLETDKVATRLCAIPKDLDKRLFDEQWSRGVATVLTSGTLSANSDFSRIKQTLGLNYLKNRTAETTHHSPFNYRKNALLYISENMSFPDQKNQDYIKSVADEVEKLILASHGHAAVLFTSYKVMDLVWEQLNKRLPRRHAACPTAESPAPLHLSGFPLFRLDKGGIKEIERFKQSDGGVLFASGAMWEGIDIPGDALSMVVIVKLPFAVPDPISEYEQTQYPDFVSYRNSIIVPEMLVKLKQGFGRLIRTETDSGVVAILDSRVNSTGGYRERVLSALPHCRVTSDIEEISEFMVTNKSIDYFDKDFHI